MGKSDSTVQASPSGLGSGLRALVGFAAWVAMSGAPLWAADCPLVYLPVRAGNASSFDDTPEWAPPQNPLAPFDGNFETRWASLAGRDREWITADLGQPKRLSKVVIHWERAYATDYELQVSDDGKAWRSLTVLHDQDGGVDEITVPETTARYLQMIGLKRSHPDWGISVWEMESYGCQASNPGDLPVEQVFPGRQLRATVHLTMEEPLPSPGPVGAEEFQRGMVYLSFHENQLAASESDAQLKELAELHVTHLALVVTWYQDTLDTATIYPESPEGGRTPVDEALVHAINRSHALGMKVMLKPHVDVESGEFRGDIPGSEAWFASYRSFIRHYAQMASRYHVELFCIGTELAGTSYVKWESAWRQVIEDARAVYHGPIVYGANWDEFKTVPFWDAVDFIGIDAYFPLTETSEPTPEMLQAAWVRYAKEIETWRQTHGVTKPILFTEIGYGSADGANRTPWTIPSKVSDEGEQSECLQAMLTAMTARPWFRGLYWWNWFSQPVESPLGYPIRGKIAQGVLARWYAHGEAAVPAVGPSPAAVAPTPVPAPPTPMPSGSKSTDPAAPAHATVLFGFESGTQGWKIPNWALEKPDFVGKSVAVARQGATEGAQALGLVVNFPGGQWNAALAEVEEYFDWTRYQTLSVDVTLPADAPAGLKGKLILTVGESWEWTEMRRSIQLPPGQTTTLTASLASGSEDWKRTVVDDAFRKDVRKLAVRIESNKPAYQGTFSIDNVRLE